MFSGKKILVGVTGSIAAYKAVILVRLLIKAGAEVRTILTPSACDFVSPLTFSTLSKNKALVNLFEDNGWADHVMLGRWADAMIIAPASCNTIAKIAGGLCDNLLLAVYLSATCPVILAPAMDEDMWNHPATQANLAAIAASGNTVLPVAMGELASGLTGEGRMTEPEDIVQHLHRFFSAAFTLKGVNALVTAGPTHEAIDPVRYISNHSSGKMGIALAEELLARGAKVTLVLGPSGLPVNKNIHTVRVVSAKEMYDASMDFIPASAIIIMAAAVADYTPEITSDRKIKKEENSLVLKLKPTGDILKAAGNVKRNDQILIGFALETNNDRQNALRKMADKNADMIILNSVNGKNPAFGSPVNQVTIFDKRGNEHVFESKPKTEVARDIVNTIIQYTNA